MLNEKKEEEIVVELKDGTKIHVHANDFIGDKIQKSKNYFESRMLSYVQKNINRGVFLDVGANIGNHSVFFAKYCADKVYAFEPFGPNFDKLQKNCKTNRLDNIECVNKGLSDKKIEAKMKVDNVTGKTKGNNFGRASVADDGTIPIALEVFDNGDWTIDQPVTLIKIDCEGHEPQALAGMMKLIERWKPSIIIESLTKVS